MTPLLERMGQYLPRGSTPLSVEIRQAASGDADAIAALLYEAFVEFEPRYTPEGFAATAISSEEIVERMAEGPVWIALQESGVVGTASVVEKGEGLYIRGMAVVPSMQGRGIGLRLLEQVEAFALGGGFRRMFLSTTPFLRSAIRLYQHFGFRRSPEGPYDLHGTPLFTMEKPLGLSAEDGLDFSME